MTSIIAARSAALGTLLRRILKGKIGVKKVMTDGAVVAVGATVDGLLLGPGVMDGLMDGMGVGIGLSVGDADGDLEVVGRSVEVG